MKWLKAEGHSFGQEEQTAFISEAQKLNASEKKKLKSKFSDLAKVIGKDVCEGLAKELGIN